jgi:ATP-binding cassette subfamily C protein
MAVPGTFPQLLLASDRGRLVRLLALMAGSALTEGFGLVLLVPMLAALGGMADGTGTGIVSMLTGVGIPLTLGPLLTMFVALVLLRSLTNYARTLAAQRFEAGLVDSLRARAWDALLHCDWRTLSAMRQSDNASLLITNIDRVGFGVSQGLGGLAATITLAGIGLAALTISPAIALSAAVGAVVVLFAYRGMRKRAAALGEKLSAAYGDVYSQFQEGLGALRVIKSFGREDEAAERGTRSIAELRVAQIQYLRDMGLAQIALQGGGALLLAGIVWYSATQWDAGATRILPLVALFARALPLVGQVQQAWQNWAHARPALQSTTRLIDQAEAAREPDTARPADVPKLQTAIELRDVTVHYAGRDRAALDGVCASFAQRTVTALIGPSGAGKSTMADLLGGLLAPDAGQVVVDGTPLDPALRRAWRARVAYVQQEPVLFAGTIRANLLWAAPDADDARLAEVLAAASAQFVLDLPDAFDTRVGEGGRALSGGERQRIVLARALLRDPSLLILDEAVSALDAENEAAIAAAIGRLRERLAIVIIGHRGPLAELADTVLRVEKGRIVA